ncbi:RNA polymerase sigma factor [Arcticibacterium luteifluviistationis]|uniref:Sigma-70 family RNA polymerase sigma factor n=1 Tax=Arcticibacterium luteifluviistationis TaxID=1784714 RepID=A0A2Z4GHH6_9BACT|nr:sigma-70 family RNA polymerase sigma factor [Arcticibacterium luteifluviistationis]AWW00486.1 hypothetical protein DJ013_20805 [Arcticibacterium luteifluviistationis]
MTDKDIIEGIKAGGLAENRAIEQLYEQNKMLLLGFLRKFNNQENAKEPEDIIWEGIEALVNNVRNGKYSFKEGVALNSYLKSILKNLWFKQLSSESARLNRQHTYFDQDQVEPDVYQLLSDKETWDNYLQIFEKIGKNCKRILHSVFGLGYTIKELGAELVAEGVYDNEQVLRNAKSKCLKKLMQVITDTRFR